MRTFVFFCAFTLLFVVGLPIGDDRKYVLGLLLGPAVIAATVAAAASTVTTRLKARLDAEAERERAAGLSRETYRRYADPLASSAESLFYRLREILVDDRQEFLMSEDPTDYEAYKRKSTTYRLAALLGWMRALRRELTRCGALRDSTVEPMSEALNALTKCLADGGPAEERRARALADLWHIQSSDVAKLGRDCHVVLSRFLHDAEVENAAELSQELQKLDLVNAVARALGRPGLRYTSLDTEASEALRLLSLKKAWIYRDWQDAIGDMMLTEVAGREPQFTVKGYREFCVMAEKGGDPDVCWHQRLDRLTDSLDISAAVDVDTRVALLKDMYATVAVLLVRFHQAEPDRSNIGEDALDKAREVAQLPEPVKRNPLKVRAANAVAVLRA